MPFLGRLINTLLKLVLYSQRKQVWFILTAVWKKETRPLFISRAQSYVKHVIDTEKDNFPDRKSVV